MEQLLTLPDITATKTRSRLEEEGGPGRAQSQNVQSSRLAASAQWAKHVQWWSGSPSEGGGWGALARVLYAKRPHSSQVPQSETLVELRALAKDSVEAKQGQHSETPMSWWRYQSLLQSRRPAGQEATQPGAQAGSAPSQH